MGFSDLCGWWLRVLQNPRKFSSRTLGRCLRIDRSRYRLAFSTRRVCIACGSARKSSQIYRREGERDDGVRGLVPTRSGFLGVFVLIGEVSVCVFLCLSMGTTEPLVSEVEGMSLVAREVVAKAKYSGRVIINAILGRQDGGIALIGQKVIVGGWVKTGRVVGRSTSAFLELNDGSCSANLQVIYAFFPPFF